MSTQLASLVAESPRVPSVESVVDRIFECIVLDENDCWVWTRSVRHNGYARVPIGSTRAMAAHRATFEFFRGDIPRGKQLDHLCRVRRCVNPWHLEPVTNRENVLRGTSPAILAHRANRCKRGHSLHDAYVSNNGRTCRSCIREGRA